MEEENAPLLDNEGEIPTEVPNPREKIRSLYASDRVLGRHSHYNGNEGGTINITASSSVQNFAEVDQIVSIFVVAFDTKAGNVIEWCLPDDSDLEGVEFKSMTSGSHTLRTDFVYFKKDNLFGLACFENMPVESEIERGARMKSVGILATSYTLLYRHMQFLQTQVRHLLEYRDTMAVENGHQLETPGRYGQLQAFWEDKKGMLPTSPRPPGLLPTSESYNSLQLGGYTPGGSPDNDMLPELKITHPTGSFSQFIQFFGAQIFVLWKYTLLGKRILFFSPPPIGDVCYRVYCTCSLALSNLSGGFSTHELRPHFYVNVADIDTLETEMSYIACTTEKIFESKTRLYDVYVNNQNVTTHSPILKDLLKPSEGDYDKLKKLNNQRSAQRFASEELGEPALSEEEVFMTFFLEQNNRLFQTLMDVSASQDRTLTSDHMKAMGLDPTGDRNFVMELVESYGIDVMLMVDNPCCPR